MLLVETVDLTKRYGPRAVVDRVGLQVRRGEVYGFLGPNGAGKTTMLRLLLGLIRASSGSAWVLGAAPGVPAALARIGMLVEAPAFYPYLSGRDNLLVFHEGTSASGNTNFTGTVTLQKVVAEDAAGNVYSIRGAEWFGVTENAQQGGTFQATFTGKLQVVAQGSGTVDSVNVTEHITSVNGNIKEFDFGTCVAP
jgi:ABC-type Fe3+/spermidine/putrescine transport system ATPase subunit